LSASDTHFIRKKTSEIFPSIFVYVYLVSLVHGFDFNINLKITNSTNPAIGTVSLNYPSENTQSLVLGCVSTLISYRRLLKNHNDVLDFNHCLLDDFQASTLVSNCALYFNRSCKLCNFDQMLSSGSCVIASSVYDYIGNKYLGPPSMTPINSNSTLNQMAWQIVSAVFAPYSTDHVVFVRLDFQSNVSKRVWNHGTMVIWNSIDMGPVNPFLETLTSVELDARMNSLVSEITQFLTEMQLSELSLVGFYSDKVHHTLYAPASRSFQTNMNCSYFGLLYLELSPIEAKCVSECPDGYFQDKTSPLCWRLIPNCLNRVGEVCLLCSPEYLLVNNRCYRTKYQQPPTTVPTDSPKSMPEIITPPPLNVIPAETQKISIPDIDCSSVQTVDAMPAFVQQICLETCKSKDSNCQLCNKYECLHCSVGFHLNGSTCVRNTCTDSYCQTCSIEGVCLQCASTHVMGSQGACVSDPKSQSPPFIHDLFQEILDSEQKTEAEVAGSPDPEKEGKDCPIEFCMTCAGPDQCVRCQDLYELSNSSTRCIRGSSSIFSPIILNTLQASTPSVETDDLSDGNLESSTTLCTTCQIRDKKICTDNPSCQSTCKCLSRRGSSSDSLDLFCPNISFNRTQIDLTRFENNPFTLSLSEYNPHTLHILFEHLSLKVRSFKLLNAYVNQTENCVNDEGRLYLALEKSSFSSQAKPLVAITDKGAPALTVTSIFALQTISWNLSQIIIGLVSLSNFLILVNLLNIRLGSYFDLIYQIMTENEFLKENLIHFRRGVHEDCLAYSASRSRLWKFVSRSAFQFSFYCSLGYLSIHIILKVILKLARAQNSKKRLRKFVKWMKAQCIVLFTALMDFNYMGMVTVYSGIISQGRADQSPSRSLMTILQNLITIWGFFYAKSKSLRNLMKANELRSQSESIQVKMRFSPVFFFFGLHDAIQELLQTVFGVLLFTFQKYAAAMLRLLVFYACVEIYLCFAFAGKYYALVTVIKLLYSLSFFFFIVTAQTVYDQNLVTTEFLNITILVLLGLKILDIAVTIIVSLVLQRKLSAQSTYQQEWNDQQLTANTGEKISLKS